MTKSELLRSSELDERYRLAQEEDFEVGKRLTMSFVSNKLEINMGIEIFIQENDGTNIAYQSNSLGIKGNWKLEDALSENFLSNNDILFLVEK